MSALTATHRAQALAAVRPRHLGRVADLRGLHLTVTGLRAAVGELLEVLGPDGVVPIEVVASSRDNLTCLPLAGTSGLRAGDHVHHTGDALRIGVGEELRGRVVDGLGRPLDGGPPLDHLLRVSVEHPAPRALSRPRIAEQLGLGVRALDAMTPCGRGQRIGIMAGSGVGEELRGRVVDGLGRPLDGGPSLDHLLRVSVEHPAPRALSRPRIAEQLGLGVRALDAMTPCGRGQRIGIMAGSGVGKSSLLSMIARGTDAELSVIALIGERGREVREFLENDLGPEGLSRSVVVVSTSDEPPVVRLRAAFVATRIAEWFRDSGRHVVLMMDSLTRVALAQREIGLSAGEPPATRGFPPSVFALLPRLLERAGTAPEGSITGLYTVLVEGDDMQDPVGDTARSILDGHVVLSRDLATAGHFPSIDVLESISRVAGAVTGPGQKEDAQRLRRLLAAYRSVRELVEIGAYVAGSDADADAALALMPRIDGFLRQDMADVAAARATWDALHELVAP